MPFDGPVPKSDEQKALEGNPGKRPSRQGVKAPKGAPVMPKDLPDEAKALWRRIVPKLEALGVLSPLDQMGLTDLCMCWVHLQQCERDIAERGELVLGERGLVKNPSCQLAREYRLAMLRWASEFGLTPSGRARMSLPDRPKDDPFAGLLD